MKPTTYMDIIEHSLASYYKISAKHVASGELYIKLYTPRTDESVIEEFEEKFNVKELHHTIIEPPMIENDIEPGVEFLITFWNISLPPPILG